jgi:hypothetical protein
LIREEEASFGQARRKPLKAMLSVLAISLSATRVRVLGIPDLCYAAFALRLRWLWFKRMDNNRPWKQLELDFGRDSPIQQFFQSSVEVILGDRNLALFWQDQWNGANSSCVIVPTLYNIVCPRARYR